MRLRKPKKGTSADTRGEYYPNVFMYGSRQFAGNMEEYFRRHTTKLVVYVLTSGEESYNEFRLYHHGQLADTWRVPTYQNRFLYYFSWYVFQQLAFLRYYRPRERVVAICGHPVSFVGGSILRLFRNVEFVYMVGDYFPGINILYSLFHTMKLFYHRRIPYSFYLSDAVNEKMNGHIEKSNYRKTIMWGVKPKGIVRKRAESRLSLLFVGLVKEGQGLELAFRFLKAYPEYRLSIIGISHPLWLATYRSLIQKYGIEDRVYYPNVFMSDADLDRYSRKCFVGIAPYDLSQTNVSYFADPGKVKAYMEMGLPVIMTDTTAIAPYVRKFGCGIVIKPTVRSFAVAVRSIESSPGRYRSGVRRFTAYFNFESYYRERFEFLKELFPSG